MQHHMTCPLLQFVNIHHTNMYYHTGNVCCVIVITYNVFIFHTNNKVGIIKTHLLQFFSYLSLNWMVYSAWRMLTRWKENMSFVFSRSRYCDTCKNIHQKVSCYDGNTYCWFPHKFLYSRNTKDRVALSMRTNYRD